MVVDTSILIAILSGEPDMPVYSRTLQMESNLLMSAASLIEATAVLLGRGGEGAVADLNSFVEGARIEIVPVSLAQARIAQSAYLNYGKGRHRAGLNFGDCFVYALARDSGEAVFCKGDDFNQTDIECVTISP